MNTATILITHNLGIVAGLCDRVAVMYAGRMVEIAPRDELFDDPHHPYTVGLLDCVPRVDRSRPASSRPSPGQPPDLIGSPSGLRLRAALRVRVDRCSTEPPC